MLCTASRLLRQYLHHSVINLSKKIHAVDLLLTLRALRSLILARPSLPQGIDLWLRKQSRDGPTNKPIGME
jgi:hypothetical protein